jgi:diadenosine tetraphosphate (Ap4A) HIT family hydrolase
MTCPFCTMPDDRVIDKNNGGYVIFDGFPISPGHTLIIPHRHFGSWFESTDSERSALLELMSAAQLRLKKQYQPDGFNIGINDGSAAGQTVSHLHVHLIPRYNGDVPDPRGGVRRVIPDKADYWSKQ